MTCRALGDSSRSCVIFHLANKLETAGKVTPSPIPIAARVASSAGREHVLAAKGVAIVHIDQKTTPTLSTSFGLHRVAM